MRLTCAFRNGHSAARLRALPCKREAIVLVFWENASDNRHRLCGLLRLHHRDGGRCDSVCAASLSFRMAARTYAEWGPSE